MTNNIQKPTRRTLKEIFIQKLNYWTKHVYPDDLDEDFKDIFYECNPYTELSVQRAYATYQAAKYVIESGIEGDFVEGGIYRGGSMMIVLKTLLKLGVTDRKVYLYDTYTGMPEPSKHDVKPHYNLHDKWSILQEEDHNEWCYCSLEDVKKNIYSTGYPKENLIFIKGMVEDTIPKTVPGKIAFLRLDMDFYSPTNHSLIHLFPLLAEKGVFLLDDYGSWKGCRKAVDDYFKNNNVKMLLNRTDISGRMGIK